MPTSKSAAYQESVITNTESMETKQTKKRKAVSAANTPNTIVDFGAAPPTIQVPVIFSKLVKRFWYYFKTEAATRLKFALTFYNVISSMSYPVR